MYRVHCVKLCKTSEDETDTGEGEGHTTEASTIETTKQNKVVVLFFSMSMLKLESK